MGWIEKLDKTYDLCLNVVGKEVNDDPILLPISHSTANAQIELTVDMNGNFVKELTEIVPKNGKEEVTIIPVTEDSASRGNGNFPHALCDKLCYVAGDYFRFTGDRKEEYFEEYLKKLRQWVESEYSSPLVRAVYTYVAKRNLIQDLVDAGFLKLDGDGMLSEKENKLHQQPQADAFVRFAVVEENGVKQKLWKNQKLYELFADYYYSTLQERSLDYVSGRMAICTEKHPSKIRNTADKAKLISGNDDVGFTYRGRFQNKSEAVTVGYETSQKAHNALRWLLRKQGYTEAGSAIVVWKLPEHTEAAEQEKDSLKVPDIFADTANAFSFAWEEGEVTDEEDLDTGNRFARQFNLAVAGYAGKFHAEDSVVMMAVDAATPGRLSITYYHEFAGNDFIQKVIHWHQTCTWCRRVRIKDTGKTVWMESAPSPKEMVLAAFGVEQVKGYLSCDDKLLKASIQRILPCIVGLCPKIPADILRGAINRVSNPVGYSSFVWRNQVLAVTCAMIKYNKYNGKVDWLKLEKNRSYLFGRLLAIMEVMEQKAMYTGGSNDEERLTNAKKLWNAYTRRPAITYDRLFKKLMQGYVGKLKPGTRNYFEKEIMEIVNALQKLDGFDNRPLKEEYLVGYYAQREKMMKSKEKENETEGGNE